MIIKLRWVLYPAIFGFSLKLTSLYFITWDWLLLLNFLKKKLFVSKNQLMVFGISISLFSIVCLLEMKTLDIGEFLSSFINFFLFFVAVILVNNFDARSVDRVLAFLSKITLAFVLWQLVSYLVFNQQFAYFVFDGISISTAEEIGRFEAVNLLGYMRPIGQYHEPSFLALVANLIFAHRLHFNCKLDVASVMVIILSLSMVGIVTLAVTVLLRLKLLTQLLVVLSLCLLVYTNVDFFRLNELLIPGTSGHERIGVMVNTLDVLLKRSLLPIPLGNWETLPNNSLQVIIGYYSIFTIPIVFTFLKAIPLRLWGVLAGILLTNGAIFTFSGGVMLGLITSRK